MRRPKTKRRQIGRCLLSI